MIELARWRDAAMVLLAAEALLLGLLLASGLYLSLRGVLQLRQWIQPVLLKARMHVWRVCRVTGRVMHVVVAPFVWLQGTINGMHRALDILGWR